MAEATYTSVGSAQYSQLTNEQRLFYEMMLLERAVPPFTHLWFGQSGTVFPVTVLPENQGQTIDWRKFGAFTAVTTPLTEGTTPDGMDISITNVQGTVYEYGM